MRRVSSPAAGGRLDSAGLICRSHITAITDGGVQTSRIPPGDNLNLNIFIGNPGASAQLNDSIYMRILPAEFIGKFDTRLRILSPADRNNMVIQFRRPVSQRDEAVCSPPALTAHQHSRINSRPPPTTRKRQPRTPAAAAGEARRRADRELRRKLDPSAAASRRRSAVISSDRGLGHVRRPGAARPGTTKLHYCRRRRRQG